MSAVFTSQYCPMNDIPNIIVFFYLISTSSSSSFLIRTFHTLTHSSHQSRWSVAKMKKRRNEDDEIEILSFPPKNPKLKLQTCYRLFFVNSLWINSLIIYFIQVYRFNIETRMRICVCCACVLIVLRMSNTKTVSFTSTSISLIVYDLIFSLNLFFISFVVVWIDSSWSNGIWVCDTRHVDAVYTHSSLFSQYLYQSLSALFRYHSLMLVCMCEWQHSFSRQNSMSDVNSCGLWLFPIINNTRNCITRLHLLQFFVFVVVVFIAVRIRLHFVSFLFLLERVHLTHTLTVYCTQWKGVCYFSLMNVFTCVCFNIIISYLVLLFGEHNRMCVWWRVSTHSGTRHTATATNAQWRTHTNRSDNIRRTT